MDRPRVVLRHTDRRQAELPQVGPPRMDQRLAERPLTDLRLAEVLSVERTLPRPLEEAIRQVAVLVQRVPEVPGVECILPAVPSDPRRSKLAPRPEAATNT